MQKVAILLVACLVGSIVTEPIRFTDRIVGGSLTTINNYPHATGLLFSRNFAVYVHICGGAIINNRSILSAAHCTAGSVPANFRLRVGSSFANSGGTVLNTAQIINHPSFSWNTMNNDICILRTATVINYVANTIQPVTIAGSNYNVADNSAVMAIGWGRIFYQGPVSEQLRHVQVWTINQAICRQRYATLGVSITDNMLCSGWLDVGGRDQCSGDSGGPLLHNNVVVGVCSFGEECALPFFPGVNARVSRYTAWIQSNA